MKFWEMKTPADAPAAVLASPSLARFGMHGRASGGKTQFSVQDAPDYTQPACDRATVGVQR